MIFVNAWVILQPYMNAKRLQIVTSKPVIAPASTPYTKVKASPASKTASAMTRIHSFLRFAQKRYLEMLEFEI